MSLFRRKPLDALIAEGGDEQHGLKKALNSWDLTALGIGAIIGAGIFATLGSATSGSSGAPAGPGVMFSIPHRGRLRLLRAVLRGVREPGAGRRLRLHATATPPWARRWPGSSAGT